MPPLDKNRKHAIAAKDAATMIRRHREATRSKNPVCGAFLKEPVQALLNQKGCTGVRMYYALAENGEPHAVLVGVDEAGNDMAAGTVLEDWFPCPPWCPTASPLGA